MNKAYLKELKKQYEEHLYQNILPFWIQYAKDDTYGGYMTWLDKDGSIISTDKAVWMQGRGLYIYSKAYNDYHQNPAYLAMAEKGFTFLKDYCIDDDKQLFFRMKQDGSPYIKRRYVFSDVFAAAGFMEYYRATGNKEAYHLSLQCFKTVYDVFYGYKKMPAKTLDTATPMKNHSLIMIMIDLCKTMRQMDESYDYDSIINDAIFQIKHHFFNKEKNCLNENVGLEGEYYHELPEGRLLNPGHAIETSWFILQEAIDKKNNDNIAFALTLFNTSYEKGWDQKYGGLYSFLDSEDKPPLHLEWNMKLWWPHNEALIASLMAYAYTKEDKYLEIHKTIKEYSFKHFFDKNGEWYGYLLRDGSLSSSVKGCIWKGPFHVPRFYMICITILEGLLQ